MTVTDAAARRLSRLRQRAGVACIGFRFDGTVGSCTVSKPILRPVNAPVPGSRQFAAGDVILFASGETAEILDQASIDLDDRLLFGRGLVVSWPHRQGGCPNCR
jgi:Fe-S cluster assembly iron-binding protein IscA